MSRRAVLATMAIVALVALPSFGQYSVANANGFQLDNGYEGYYIMNAGVAVATVGNVNGLNPPVVNLTNNDQMFYEILPKEYMNAGNCSAGSSMEMVGQQVNMLLSMWGSGGGVELFDTMWDQSINTVTYLNPSIGVAGAGAGPDGRRYPDLVTAGSTLVLIQGGPLGFAPPAACPAPQYWALGVTIEYATAVAGTGIMLNGMNGLTDLAICMWSPGGMSTLPADPSGCEIGGNLSAMWCRSTNERVAAGLTTGGAGPPSGVNRNPYSGFRTLSTNHNNEQRIVASRNRIVFRDPFLQQSYQITPTMATREVGSGALNMDGTAAGTTVFPSFRTEATGHLGQTVIHLLTASPTFYPPFARPGIPITPTACLRLNPNDPNTFLLTPGMDDSVANGNPIANVVASWGTNGHGWDKDIGDSPAPFGLIAPFAAPGVVFLVQAFVVDLTVGNPVPAFSTNVVTGNLF